MRSDHLSKHLKTHLASRNGLTFEGGDSDMETIDHMDANGNGVVEANGLFTIIYEKVYCIY